VIKYFNESIMLNNFSITLNEQEAFQA
jgi:hypothetical protein